MTEPRQDAMPDTRGLNFYAADPNLEFVCSSVMAPEVFERARPHLTAMGEVAGGELDALAAEADRNPPVLRAYDERGRRVDEIVRHPAYVRMERLAFERFALHAMSHRPGVLGWPGIVPHVVKYALSYLFSQSEFGLLCPVNVTDSTSRMLRHYGSEDLKAAYLPRLTSTDFDNLWQGTQWITEKTGGSDVGASTTIARQDRDGTWRLWGEKWFCSNANADVALTLARPEGAPAGTRGLGMFLIAKYLPDGTKNAWTINRLKDKLGSRSMATGEVTYAGAVACPVGDLGRGFPQMMEMVNVSRLSNALRAAGIMRRCVLESVTHARGRLAFGGPLMDLPLLRSAVLEMLLDAEAALSVVLNGAVRLDGWDAGSPENRKLFRVLTPLAKYWTTSRARVVAGEAMNVRGGNGYVEEWVNARLLRDSYLGAIWEGAANVVALDVQRALLKEGCWEPLAGFIRGRLDLVSEPAVKPWCDVVLQTLAEAERQVPRWAGLGRNERELGARPVADALYHVLAASLLLAEGQTLLERRGDFHKFAVGALYARRWLSPQPPHTPVFTARHLRWLDALTDWQPVPAEAVPAPNGDR
ncbi:MAG TPA: acyl-CoA dehydrogenase family protein [Methylomirabilota bacterium]|nr:acyl-CoA dehydrogenase family protein [Methylomirabilota bacterium]